VLIFVFASPPCADCGERATMAAATAENQIATAIKELNGCSEPLKQLLLTTVPNAFGSNLHKFQIEAASMLRKSLEQGRAAAGEAQIASAQTVEEVKTALEALNAGSESAVATQEAAQSVLDEKTTALETAKVTKKREVELCEEAHTAQGEVSAKRQKLEADKAEIESVQNGSFRMLLDGGWEDEELRDECIDAVCSYLKTEGADPVLLAALPKALQHKPADCGNFDKVAVDEALRVIHEKVSTCAALLAEGEEEYEDVKAEHLGAWAISDVAREKELAASDERDTAYGALQDRIVDKKLAVNAVDEQNETLTSSLSKQTLADGKVLQLEVALGAFAQLEAGEPEEAAEENKENAPAVVADVKGDAMAVDETPVAVAGIA